MLKTEPIYRGHEIDYVVNGMRRMADIKSIELHMISWVMKTCQTTTDSKYTNVKKIDNKRFSLFSLFIVIIFVLICLSCYRSCHRRFCFLCVNLLLFTYLETLFDVIIWRVQKKKSEIIKWHEHIGFLFFKKNAVHSRQLFCAWTLVLILLYVVVQFLISAFMYIYFIAYFQSNNKFSFFVSFVMRKYLHICLFVI